jgi:hypothetical protein
MSGDGLHDCNYPELQAAIARFGDRELQLAREAGEDDQDPKLEEPTAEEMQAAFYAPLRRSDES